MTRPDDSTLHAADLKAVEADASKQPLSPRAQEMLPERNYLRKTPPVGSDSTR